MLLITCHHLMEHLETLDFFNIKMMQVIGPPLNRCLLLVGADCLAWLAELPRSNVPALPHHSNKLSGQVLLGQKLLHQYKKFRVVSLSFAS